MREVVRFAARGGYVLGVCNGFQILTEAGLLEGALLRNSNLSFICHDVYLRVERRDTALTNAINKAVMCIPIAHGEGNFYADDETIARIEGEGRVLFRYADLNGVPSAEANPNGSRNNIAGIMNAGGNVFGMMPHPERAADATLGNADGLDVFASLQNAVSAIVG
jgi:phosphoribosylformylglycinamidine synthase